MTGVRFLTILVWLWLGCVSVGGFRLNNDLYTTRKVHTFILRSETPANELANTAAQIVNDAIVNTTLPFNGNRKSPGRKKDLPKAIGRTELLEMIQEETGFDQFEEIYPVLDAFEHVLKREVMKNHRSIRIKGLGTFVKKMMKPRNGVSPAGKVPYSTPARETMKFKASKNLMKVLNGSNWEEDDGGANENNNEDTFMPSTADST